MSVGQATLPRTANKQPPLRMSEEEFIDWCDRTNTRAEWVDGEVIVMPPVELAHARIVSFLIRLIGAFAELYDCGEVLTEPFQVRFSELRRRRAPDIIFVSNERESSLKSMGFEGGPDLIVEVVSPESQSRDRRDKYAEYEAAGVREYWIVDPLTKDVEFHLLSASNRFSPVEEVDGKYYSTVLPGFYLRAEWLWQLKPPKVADVFERNHVQPLANLHWSFFFKPLPSNVR